MGLATRDDVQVVDCRHVRYANVIYYLGMERYRETVRAALTFSMEISLSETMSL